MSTMYSRAHVMLEQAKHALKGVVEDDAYLDIACFDTQQAVEFLLKSILLEFNVVYVKTHKIRYLLKLVDSNTSFLFDKHDDLDVLADTITSWESAIDNGHEVHTTTQTIRRVHDIFNSLNTAYWLYKKQTNHMQFFDK